MAVSKKIRFEVFKRDGFTCQYCGGHPPAKILEVDHIHPVSDGGSDNIFNLVTSCFECNRGKSDRKLGLVPITLSENIDIIREREIQYKEYQKLLRNVDRRIKEEIDEVEVIFAQAYGDYLFKDAFRLSVKRFINSLGVAAVREAMEIAASKCNHHENALKYFCGICWKKIKDNG